MTDEITNKVLLEHMQGMKYELQQQITNIHQGLQQQITVLQKDVQRLEQKTDQGFEDARQHRQTLQEDLDATIRMQAEHQKKLANVSV